MRRSGLTLLEMLVSLFILAFLSTSLLVIYTSLVGGSRKSNVNQEAVAALDTVRDCWEIKIRDSWPDTPAPDAAVSYPATAYGSYTYRVDDLGRVKNPLNTSVYLEMKRVRLQLDFKDKDAENQVITRTYETIFHVVR